MTLAGGFWGNHMLHSGVVEFTLVNLFIELFLGDMCDISRRFLGQPRVAQWGGGVREGHGQHQQHREESSRNDQKIQRSSSKEH